MADKKISVSAKSRRLMIRETTTSYLFLAPFLVFFVMFVIYPMFMCVYTSFFDATMGREDIFIGFQNYKTLFNDPIFWTALKNTLVIVFVSVPVTCAFSLWVASVISKMPVAATSAFRCIFYLPVVTGSVAVTMVWKWMYNNYYGIFNYLGTQTGLLDKNINWLGDPKYALGCIILILLTTSVGQPIVLYVSALGNVDQTLVEAAQVDGAGRWAKIRYITLPGLLPTIVLMLIMKVGYILTTGFEQVLVFYSPPVYDVADIIETYVYRIGLGQANFSLATALGLFNAVVAFVLIVGANTVSKKSLGRSIW